MIRFASRASFGPRAAALSLALLASPAFAARYTYHGELLDGDAPAAGTYDVRVRAFAGRDAKRALGEATELPGVEVAAGRFTLQLDLPEAPRADLHVEVAIRKAGSGDAYEVLGAPQAVSKGAVGCWALDGNSSLPPNSFLGIGENVATPLVLRARDSAVATFTPGGSPTTLGDAPSIAFGSAANQASFPGATVGGGGATLGFNSTTPCPDCRNLATSSFATVAGGRGNHATDQFTTIGGGDGNRAGASKATVSGGEDNRAVGALSTVSGGFDNEAAADFSSVGGGNRNVAAGEYAVVGGGDRVFATGRYSAAVGGFRNCAGGDASLALGANALVRHGNEVEDRACPGVAADGSGDPNGDEGSFVWSDADPLGVPFISTGPNQFLIRARGGVGINATPPVASVELTVTSDADDSDAASLWLKQRAAGNDGMLISGVGSSLRIAHYDGVDQFVRLQLSADGSAFIRSSTTDANAGVALAVGAGDWSLLSDRAAKTAIEAVDPGQILDRLLQLPITRWSYIAQGEGIRHLGPMAQDFASAFGLGDSERHIGTLDANGVALAAIQGLNLKLERENARLRGELDALRARLDRLEASALR
jgi:hypothetical protein